VTSKLLPTGAEGVTRSYEHQADTDCAAAAAPPIAINEVFSFSLAGECETSSRPSATRAAAGGGLTEDTLKCQLKPLDFASYPVMFTAAQQARLQATFPTGVCDWSKPGVDERPPLGAWLDYGT
jgi:Tannase-like family of unknown function (DUF6351)